MIGVSLAVPVPLVRDLRPGVERKYRVNVVQDEGDRYEYRLRLKIDPNKALEKDRSQTRVDLRLSDYHATLDGHPVSSGLLGGGLMPLEPTGLPAGLSVSGPQGPIWLPMLGFYLPSAGADGGFDVSPVDLGGLALGGSGTWKRPRLELLATLSRGGKELGKLTVETTLDKAGWPERAEGTLVSADGTYRFALKRG